MSDQKQGIVLSNETPNDQGGIIYNNSINWARFDKNPVMLYRHGHDPEFGQTPIGHWENRRIINGEWVADPVFSSIPEVQKLRTLWEEGNLKASSIGGVCIWKQDRFGTELLNKDGLKESDVFIIYEGSIVPLPSNEDAIKLNSIKLYSEAELTTLDSKINTKSIIKPNKVKMENEKQPLTVKEKIVSFVNTVFSSENETPVNHLKKEPDGDEPVKTTKLPTEPPKQGVQNEAENAESEAKAKLENEAKAKAENKANAKAEKFAKRLGECESEEDFARKKADIEDEYEGEAMPEVIKKAISEKEAAFKNKKSEKVVTKDNDEKEAAKATKKEENQTIINQIIPVMKSETELTATEKTVTPPQRTQVSLGRPNVTFTELQKTDDGQKIIREVQSSCGTARKLDSHNILLNSILNDPKFAPIVEKLNMHDETGKGMGRFDLKQLASRLESRNVQTMNLQTGQVANYAEFDTSDAALATPSTIAVEWLSLFLMKLYASNKWKSEIPVFAANETSKNLGVIWTNITSDPTIYKGTQPITPANYTAADTAVSMKLIPYYLQPMLWNPLQLALLRYDQMSAQWDQALNKLNDTIDDELIYTIASLIPVASRLLTTGASFTVVAAALDAFVLNPAYAGYLLKPTLQDILRVGQLFNKQNYADGTKFVTVMDPTMDRYITADSDTKSLLTRFVTSQGDELVSYKNSSFRVRSKLALYDPNTTNIVDPAGVIPATAISAGLSFIPNQVALGIGNFNVYMVQDPTSYGFKMSADIRMGAALLRANGYGTALYTYGTGSSV